MKIIFIIATLFLFNNLEEKHYNSTNNKELNQNSEYQLTEYDYKMILIEILNHKNLNQYFHNRQVKIYSEELNIKPEIKLLYRNKPVIITNKKDNSRSFKDYLKIKSFYINNQKINISFSYEIEGVDGNLALAKVNNKWKVVTDKISEI
ncbi:hypothetical protein GCM10010992_24960 [Cloacibacterium rupense]|uniref:Lumazine-binding n=1 Tax=Cloacibacterium rupense TaxID=517423 RepID=A0ABQ2NLW7_9FLAO|nr:hypothetical protein [Cloacibacterium rupense]GGP06098.1 hypothetical protein GCM10010992_24960 [Cloacibacterium rupense]